MRFYGIDPLRLLDLPIRMFWFLSDQIERLRADESLAMLPVVGCVMGGDHVHRTVEELRERVGRPAITETYVRPKESNEILRTLFGVNGNAAG